MGYGAQNVKETVIGIREEILLLFPQSIAIPF